MADQTTDAETKPNGKPGRLEQAREKVEELQGRYEDVSHDVRRGAQRATEEISRTARRAKADVQDTARQLRHKTQDGVDRASRQVRRGYDQARRKVRRASYDIDDYVRENPGKSLLVATAVGFAVGLLVRWSHDR